MTSVLSPRLKCCGAMDATRVTQPITCRATITPTIAAQAGSFGAGRRRADRRSELPRAVELGGWALGHAVSDLPHTLGTVAFMNSLLHRILDIAPVWVYVFVTLLVFVE